MSTQSTTRCEYCGRTDDAVSTRRGRGAQALCDACDAWITERMGEMTVAVPDAPTRDSRERDADVDADSGRVLALDPDADATAALEYSSGVSYEVIGQLEAAGFETVEDLWTATRDDLLAVPHVEPADVDAILDSISTEPMGFVETLEELDPEDVDALGDDSGDGADGDPSDDDAEIL